jgi:hypothetical protein
MVRFLRGHRGEGWISTGLLREAWGKRDYRTHLTRLEVLGAVGCTGEASMIKKEARTYKLLLSVQPGKPVKSLEDGLAQVMSTKEIKVTFAGRPGIIKDLKARRAKWKAKNRQRQAK